jgi:signal transduction histidine kinase
MDRLPLSLVNATTKRKTELEKKEVYEKLVRSEQQIRNFARHLNRTLEEERARIAREIHDELGQQLAGIKMRISSLKKEQTNSTGVMNIESMLADIDDTIQGLRKIATELRPGILDTLGLIPSLEWLTREFEKKTGVQCRFQSNVHQVVIDRHLSICFFRICQEALTNISKHAQASKVDVTLKLDFNSLLLRVTDNGKGIASEKLENPFSMGLLGMRERANLADAHLAISSKKETGTTVELKANLVSYDKNPDN